MTRKTPVSSPVQPKHAEATKSANPTEARAELVVQRAQADPHSITASDVKTLQRTIGNRATAGLLKPLLQRNANPGPQGDVVDKNTVDKNTVDKNTVDKNTVDKNVEVQTLQSEGKTSPAQVLTPTAQPSAIQRNIFSKKKKTPAPAPAPQQTRQPKQFKGLKIRADAQSAKSDKDSTANSGPVNPSTLAVARIIVHYEGSIRQLLEFSDRVNNLEKIRDWDTPSLESIKDTALRTAVQNWFDSIPSAIQNVLDSPETLITPKTDDEIAAEQTFDDHLAEKRRLNSKISKQRKKHDRSWTGLGKAYHKSKFKKYRAELDAMPDDNSVIMQTERVTKERRNRMMAASWSFLTEVKAKYKAVVAAAGGAKALNLPEGADPMETLFMNIEAYSSELNKDD